MKPHSLDFKNLLLALAVMLVWGTNFVVIKTALADLPPLLFATLRFTLVLLPAVFFMKRPQVSWANLAGYGIFIGAGQFGLLFLAMKSDVSPGLASLLLQAQVFFTVGLSVFITRETVKRYQWAALAIAASGLVLIALNTGGSITMKGLLMTQIAAFSWACGNLVCKRAGNVNMLAYIVWSSLFAMPCLLVLTLVFEGWPAIHEGVANAKLSTWLAILWQTIGNSMFGYAVWGGLLSRYPTATVAPMALLIPVFGMAASGLILGEAMPMWKCGSALLIVSGLALNVLGPKISRATLAAAKAPGD